MDKDSGEIINNETWLCSPLEVVGSGSDGAERYLVLRWRSPRGHEDITRAIPVLISVSATAGAHLKLVG